MRLFRYLLLLFLFFLCESICSARIIPHNEKSIGESPKQLHVVVLIPEPKVAPFWHSLLTVMLAAAKDLYIDLEIQTLAPGEHNRFSLLDRFEAIGISNTKPDYFISPLQLGVEKELLEIIEKYQLNYVSINSYIPASQYALLGKPREKYRHWLGHISPNDFLVGKELAEYLFQVTKANMKHEKSFNLIGITAPKSSLVGQQRAKGLFQALEHRPEFMLAQVAYSNWNKDETFSKVDKLLKRHENISILWSVSGDIALGALAAVKENNLVPGRDVFIGGIDWTEDGLAAIKKGEMEVSYGGHFLDGAKALILAYDHYNGHDFTDHMSAIIETKLRAITHQNVLFFERFFKKTRWDELNFKKFSLFEQPAKRKYDFEIENFLILNKKGN